MLDLLGITIVLGLYLSTFQNNKMTMSLSFSVGLVFRSFFLGGGFAINIFFFCSLFALPQCLFSFCLICKSNINSSSFADSFLAFLYNFASQLFSVLLF
mmetsp:Transcript_24814/g.32888  ORF Transcript_24814/g.32888 Transcript_24814/m.32888 type:complete len:99 (-) Transcript_24814:108-404(-)